MSKKKNKYDYRTFTESKPKGWKCISPLFYSNVVRVKDSNSTWLTIGSINITYKIREGRRIDEVWLKENLCNRFGKDISYNTSVFLRDNANMSFLEAIYMTKEEYIKITREEKLKRICDDKED